MTVAIKARPTTYKGIKMRSRLEAKFAARMDQYGDEWEYEPECFADETGQYLPDFKWNMGPTVGWVWVEVKPTSADAKEALRRMHIIRSSDPDAALIVMVGDGMGGWKDSQKCLGAKKCPYCWPRREDTAPAYGPAQARAALGALRVKQKLRPL